MILLALLIYAPEMMAKKAKRHQVYHRRLHQKALVSRCQAIPSPPSRTTHLDLHLAVHKSIHGHTGDVGGWPSFQQHDNIQHCSVKDIEITHADRGQYQQRRESPRWENLGEGSGAAATNSG